jgi:DNA-binding CsgD family transcriptional regulator
LEPRPVSTRLTTREREIATLIGLGFTNRQIGVKLSISERTAGAHVQNILNKLGVSNRAQIASWSATDSLGLQASGGVGSAADVPAGARRAEIAQTIERSRLRPWWIVSLVAALAVIVAVIADGRQSSLPAAALPAIGALAYEAKLAGDGNGFSVRYILGDPSASAIRFVKGAVEYSVLKPGGNTGHSVAVAPMLRYFEEVELSVVPDSNVQFWITLTNDSSGMSSHLIGLSTGAEAMQLVYLADQTMQPLGPQVAVKGLQSGRKFTVWALVNPPQYEVYLDARTVIDLKHDVITAQRIPGFGIFGDAPGTVRLTSLRVYNVR